MQNATKPPNDLMNWDELLESFCKITTESNSDGSLEKLPTVNTVDITELLFDADSNKANSNEDVDYDLANLTLSPFVDRTDKKDPDLWVGINNLQPIQTEIVPPKMEIKSKAMQLSLANEIEVQAPWVDVSVLAASISETPVTIKEKSPESIFTLATSILTHMQSYIDLNTEVAPTANIMSHMSFDLDTPTILDVGDKVFNDSEIVSNEPSKLFNDSGIVADLDNPSKLSNELESETVYFGSEEDRSLNTPPPCIVQQNIEINPANSVLFNTDLDLEDTLLFDNEPLSNMYVVRTENIFGKEIAKRNALEQLAADSGICACMDCKCDPTDGECRNCNQDIEVPNPSGCGDDTCSCVDCKCDHASMKCAVGCGRATDSNHNTFLHYHKRHNNSNLEDLGIYTSPEESLSSVVDSLKCSCSASDSCNPEASKKGSCCQGVEESHKSCCVTICFKKLNSLKQFLNENDLIQALKSHNLTTSM